MTFEGDAAFASKFEYESLRFAMSHVYRNILPSVSSFYKDANEATDYEVGGPHGSFAVRVRRHTKHRDLTIRARRKSGVKTELAKIKEGFADFYLYVWTDDETVREWVMVDLAALRKSGLLNDRFRERWNYDGSSSFIAIGIDEIQDAGALVGGVRIIAGNVVDLVLAFNWVPSVKWIGRNSDQCRS